MQAGTVQMLISIFDQSFRELGVDASQDKLESLAVTVHHAMTGDTRQFHTLEHVFKFIEPQNAIVSLAALYHDVVYYQVDRGFSAQIWGLISPYIRQEQDCFFVKENIPNSERLFYLSMEIFDLKPGQSLSPSENLNEFLSALVMNIQLGGMVSEKKLVLMTLCIEATVPFRAITSEGRNHFDLMEARLTELIERYHIDLNRDGLVSGIKKAVVFANKDIGNFAEPDPSRFLDSTWKLLPETNTGLRFPDVYTIGTYRQALQQMDTFFENLNVDTVFNHYRGVPSQVEYARMLQFALNNIRVSREYLGIKILAVSILEALALATGGDVPLTLFLGGFPRDGESLKRLEFFLPEMADPAWVDLDSTIYQLLESGRANEASFDVKNSLLSLFVYKCAPPETISGYLERMRDFYAGELSPVEFLNIIDPSTVQPIARASSIMVSTRRKALLEFAGPAISKE